MPIPWKDEFSVNIKEIDDQHKQFIEILNKLYDALEKLKIKSELGKILNELIEYAELHFSTEENYFDQCHYENSDEHKEEHRKIKEKLADFKKQYQDEKIEITSDFVDFVEDWLVDHLESQDQKYVKCLNKCGIV
jgi:hemerythrin